MHFIRTAALLAFGIVVSPAFAEGFVDLVGKLPKRKEVVVVTEPPLTVLTFTRTPAGALIDTTEYKGEPCIYLSVEPASYERRIFECTAAASSIFAGTRYIGTRVKAQCESGAPEFVYRCVLGCGKRSRAPRVLTQNYWECG